MSMAQGVKEGDAIRTDKTAKARAESSAAEVDWRSTERLNSPAAYKAYLAAFPERNFFFARADHVGGPGGHHVAGLCRTCHASDRCVEALFVASGKQCHARPRSWYPAFGPGPLTVGWGDSKKQILLPSGEWILLSAVDSKSSQALQHLG